MALNDIWRAATTVKTFNDATPGDEKFFEWNLVTHYRDDEGMAPDFFSAFAITNHQTLILQTHLTLFAGNTRIVNLKAVNLTSSFVLDQVVNLSLGIGGEDVLPPQVAVCVYGRGAALGRRAIKYYSSISTNFLGANGVLKLEPLIESLATAAFSPVPGFFGGNYPAGMWGPTLTPDFVPVTRTFESPTWRSQRRRALTMTQN